MPDWSMCVGGNTDESLTIISGNSIMLQTVGTGRLLLAIGIIIFHQYHRSKVLNYSNNNLSNNNNGNSKIGSASTADIGSNSNYNSTSARFVLLPVYTLVLLVWALTELFQGTITILLSLSVLSAHSISTAVLSSLAYSLQHFCIEGLALFLTKQGAGIRTVKSTSIITGIYCIFNLILFLVIDINSSKQLLVLLIQLFNSGLLLIFYFILYIVPYSVIYRRPALIDYSLFWFIHHLLYIIAQLLVYFNYNIGQCINLFLIVLLFGLFKLFIMFYTLLADSRYWCGNFNDRKGYSRKDNSNSIESQSNSMRRPLLGTQLGKYYSYILRDNVGQQLNHAGQCNR